MYLGKIVEMGKTENLITDPKHPYTQSLINAVPIPDPNLGRDRVELRGEVGDAIQIPSGCRFKNRCEEYIGDVCDQVVPPLEQKRDVDDGREVACHLYGSHESPNSVTKTDKQNEKTIDTDGGNRSNQN
jgi:peptide/nickel transport system ATP-binding protein